MFEQSRQRKKTLHILSQTLWNLYDTRTLFYLFSGKGCLTISRLCRITGIKLWLLKPDIRWVESFIRSLYDSFMLWRSSQFMLFCAVLHRECRCRARHPNTSKSKNCSSSPWSALKSWGSSESRTKHYGKCISGKSTRRPNRCSEIKYSTTDGLRLF